MTKLEEAEQQIKADADTLIIVATRLGIIIRPLADGWLAKFDWDAEDAGATPRGYGATPLEALDALTKARAEEDRLGELCTYCPKCCYPGIGLSTCKQCGEFIPMTLAKSP